MISEYAYQRVEVTIRAFQFPKPSFGRSTGNGFIMLNSSQQCLLIADSCSIVHFIFLIYLSNKLAYNMSPLDERVMCRVKYCI